MTEASIIELYFARSEAAIDESERAYGSFCRRIAMNVLADHEDAEESVNDTWLAAWNAIPPTRPDSLKAYFGRLTRRISISRLRKRNAAKRGGGEAELAFEELSECIAAPDDPQRAVETAELIAALNAFLAALPETERDLFVARYFFTLPLAELSERFALRENTVKSKLRRTRQKLLQRLQKEGLL